MRLSHVHPWGVTRAIEGIPGGLRTRKCGVWGIQEESTAALRSEEPRLTACSSEMMLGRGVRKGGVSGNPWVQRVQWEQTPYRKKWGERSLLVFWFFFCCFVLFCFLRRKWSVAGRWRVLFSISSRARAGAGEAPREVSTREMIGLEARRHPGACFLPWAGENCQARSFGDLGKLALSSRED